MCPSRSCRSLPSCRRLPEISKSACDRARHHRHEKLSGLAEVRHSGVGCASFLEAASSAVRRYRTPRPHPSMTKSLSRHRDARRALEESVRSRLVIDTTISRHQLRERIVDCRTTRGLACRHGCCVGYKTARSTSNRDRLRFCPPALVDEGAQDRLDEAVGAT